MFRATLAALASVFLAAALIACGESAESKPSGDTMTVCPSKFKKLLNENAKADEELAPPGAKEVLVCKFGGFGEGGSKVARTGSLVDQVHLRDTRSVMGLSEVLNQLPEFTGRRLCAIGSGVKYLMIFHFDDDADNVVVINRAGCELVSNGVNQTSYALERRLDRELKQIFDVQ